MLPLQPVLEDALLAPHLLALAPAALAEQSAHGALVTWSHTGHTLSVVTHWRGHTECGPLLCYGRPWRHQATLPLAASVGVVTTGRPPDTPTPGPQPGAQSPEVNVSGSVDIIFIVSSLHRTN